MDNCKPDTFPFPIKALKSPTSDLEFDNLELYRHLVGSLQYLTITLPYIYFAVHKLCQAMHIPPLTHFHLLKHFLGYIKGTLNLGLSILPSDLQLRAYFDSNWAGDSLIENLLPIAVPFLAALLFH
ncbi:hypothetical protein KFK09_009419 [Dendrobium nobile]|uniref:Mitochondrial protein n=1 Tax=Dendrobium nobile TaxID=94219 RepID=A0A8T3BKV8_DENNO|nr:hypothetical protein KFK09_009419 [Dendrobium nobile]